jgi:hypothetical protein
MALLKWQKVYGAGLRLANCCVPARVAEKGTSLVADRSEHDALEPLILNTDWDGLGDVPGDWLRGRRNGENRCEDRT